MALILDAILYLATVPVKAELLVSMVALARYARAVLILRLALDLMADLIQALMRSETIGLLIEVTVVRVLHQSYPIHIEGRIFDGKLS